MKRILLLLTFLALSGAAHAGTGYYITFLNHLDYPVQASLIDTYSWHPMEFQNPVYAPAGGVSATFYTESGIGPGIIRIDLSAGKYRGERLEIWQDGYGHDVQYNISRYTLDSSVGWRDPARRFGSGTSSPGISTAITARPDGAFGTVHAVVIID